MVGKAEKNKSVEELMVAGIPKRSIRNIEDGTEGLEGVGRGP